MNGTSRCTLVLSAALLFPGCGDSGSNERSRVIVFAATSTADATHAVAKRIRAQRGVDAKVNLASTSTLAQQVINGAEAGVLISADERWADYLQQRGRVVRRCDLLGNRMVVIVPSDSKIKITRPEDLLDPRIRHLALADPDTVPAGTYAKTALKKLGMWEQLRPKVVAATDVRQALAYVETATAEAGIVYSTDARVSSRIRVQLTLRPELTGPIRYPILLLKNGEQDPAAKVFFEYLRGPEAEQVFKQWGFEILGEPGSAEP